MANLSNINGKFLFTTGSDKGLLTVLGTTLQNSNTAGIELSNTHSSQTVIFIENTTTRGYELAVGGSSNSIGAGSFYIYDAQAQSARLIINTAGEVGIGTSTPNGALQVNQNSSAPIIVHRPNNTNFDPHGIGFSTRSDALNGGLGDVRSGIFSDYNGDLFLAAATSSITTSPLTYSRIFIEGGNGQVGIGTVTPQKKFHIEGTGGASEMQILVSGASDTVGHTAGIGLRAEGGEADSDARIKGGIFFERIAGSFGNGKMILAVNSSVSNTSVTVADHALTIDTNKNVGIGVTSPTSKLTLPQEEENGFKIEFTGGSYSSGISTVDQSGSGLYIGANSYVNNGGSITYKDSALDSNGIYFDAWNGNNMKFYTALAGTPQQRMSIAGDGAVLINGTTNLIGKLRVGGTTLATSSLHVYDSIGDGGSLWSIGENATFAYTAHKQWTSLSGSPTPTAAYYNIGTIGDSRSAIIVIKTAAHSCATILVSRGYGPSNVARFQVLSSTKNQNSNYANITGIQISGGGAVDIKLQWSVGPLVAIEIAVYGLGFTIANTLSVSGASTGANYPLNVLWQHDLPADAGSAMVPGQFRVQGNIVNPGTWGTTTGSAANMHVDSNGTFFRSTSSLKYKKDVRNYDKGLNEVMQLKPKYYKGKDDGDVQFAGLIAEDVHDLGLNEFVQYAEDGTPDALAYPNMIALLTKAIQELKAEIELLKNK